MTLRERVNRFPPFLCRLVARKQRGYQALSDRDLAKLSGVSRNCVRRVLRLRTWDTVPLARADRIALACGVNLLATQRHVEWLKRGKKLAWQGREGMVRRLLCQSLNTVA